MKIDVDLIEAHLPPLRPSTSGCSNDAEQAVSIIPDGARVFVGGGAAAPMALLRAMVAQRHRWTHLELVMPMLQQRLPVFEHPGEPFHFVTLQASPAFKYLWGHRALRVQPARYSDYTRLCAPDGPLACDVALVTVSPPERGSVSLGLSVGSVVVAARTVPLVLGQVNSEIPYTLGAGELPVGHFDALVVETDPVRDSRVADEADPIADAIGDRAATVIGDGSTIQFGVGSIPNAILARLSGHRGLRVHSGLVSEACLRLHEAGVIEGPMIAGEVVNSPVLRAWIHRNPNVLMAPPSITHGAATLAGIEQFVAINSAVEVALDGSANLEMVGTQVISGPGGAPDFAFGASISNGGRHLTALKSTAGGGTISRLVEFIEPPRPVTLPSYLADVVVTEHGLAEVRALGGVERARALVGVADPALRARLAR